MRKKENGFMIIEVLFSLVLLSMAGLVLTTIFSNGINFQEKNSYMSNLRLESQNLIDSLNNDKNNIYLKNLKDSREIRLEKNDINFTISRQDESDKLWRLNIFSQKSKGLKIEHEWVVIVEKPK